MSPAPGPPGVRSARSVRRDCFSHFHNQTSPLKLTTAAVIPTRNRPADLAQAVRSIIDQTKPPEELIIVDQSSDDDSKNAVRALCVGNRYTELIYIHDPQIAGLVDAKRVGSARSRSDIVCFLEDDVVLEPNYIAAITSAYIECPAMVGCGGVITNPPASSSLYLAAHRFFFRGIFRDPRPAVFANAELTRDRLIRCDVLSGGVSSWRREVFEKVHFDTRNGLHMFEDMDFATRVVRTFGHHLYVNPLARLAHYGSPLNRDVHGARQRRKVSEAIIFYKKRRDWSGATVGLAMGLTWWFAEAAFQAVKNRSSGPLLGYCRGALDGVRRPVVS
jgi:GT2 family glycosyltransferase